MNRIFCHRRAAGLGFALIFGLLALPAMAGEVLVYAASSLTDAMGKVASQWEQQSGNKVTLSFASSSTLARQIAHGAQADVYVSADLRWMDYLAREHRIAGDTRVNLLANRLVLVAPAASKQHEVEIKPAFPLAEMLGEGYLAMGNPMHVPAGIYGKQALTSLGVWDAVKDHVARSANVRAALALVATGEAPLGIVYQTGALVSDKVRIVGVFPPSSHKPVTYPLALTVHGRDNKTAQAFWRYLQSHAAGKLFAHYGFTPLDD